jgi:hypothetical protein
MVRREFPDQSTTIHASSNYQHHQCTRVELEMSHGGVGTLPAPILEPTRGNKRHVTREKLGTLASEHKGKCAQLIAEIARQSVPDQWKT